MPEMLVHPSRDVGWQAPLPRSFHATPGGDRHGATGPGGASLGRGDPLEAAAAGSDPGAREGQREGLLLRHHQPACS